MALAKYVKYICHNACTIITTPNIVNSLTSVSMVTECVNDRNDINKRNNCPNGEESLHINSCQSFFNYGEKKQTID